MARAERVRRVSLPDLRRGIRSDAARALGVAALALTAAACLPRTRPAPDPAIDETWVYTCADNYQFSARVLPGVVSLRLPTRTTALARVGSSTGMRYRADGAELHRTGETATLRLGAEAHANCTGQRADTGWDEARMLGADFRAVGLEPAWNLEIDSGRQMRFLIEGSSEVITPAPAPVRSDSSTAFTATAGGHTLDVMVQERACPNPLLGAGLTHTVRLTVDGFPYLGCGRMLGSQPAGG